MDIGTAIMAINPNAKCSINNEDFNQISWNEGTVPISKDKIETKMIELQAEYDAQAYARNRKAEYPDMGTQFNKIYDDGIDAWKTDMVDPIKAKYPKP